MAPLALGISVVLLVPAQAFAKALVRFVHAVPGVGTATVSVNDGTGKVDVGTIRFGQSTTWHSIRSGRFRWSLAGAGKKMASGTASVGNGAYDILVQETGSKVGLGIYKARGGEAGTSLVRIIHSAPELGNPGMTVDGKLVVKRLVYTHATPYLSLAPGGHTLGAARPGSATAAVTFAHMISKAGQAYSAIVLGSRGQMVRVVTLVDRGAPLVRHATTTSVSSEHPIAAGASTVMVQSGDSLWSIASRLVGPGASGAEVERKLHAIWHANEARIGTGDPNLIFPGTRLRV